MRVFGRDRNEMYLCSEALRSLLYPFRWLQSYQSYESLRDFGNSGRPYGGIVGIDLELENMAIVVKTSVIVMLDDG